MSCAENGRGVGVVHAGGCLSFAVNSFEQNNTERLVGRSAKVVACYFFCAFPNRASAQCEQAFAMAAAVPKVQKASVRSIIASFGLVFSSRRSAFVIVLSTLARVKLAVLVGVQCKKFLPKMSSKFYLWG
ncbi:hypothetical protein T01_11363 [Trichinella spiralis]|uniref:Uncharacterized protein n=1 Tax=Trichinella spiralis TaxID=6334 RepID=A0A0V1B4Q8_TRISP|nr:hypothetical protein T01_11363 [Trichinella spiralis]